MYKEVEWLGLEGIERWGFFIYVFKQIILRT